MEIIQIKCEVQITKRYCWQLYKIGWCKHKDLFGRLFWIRYNWNKNEDMHEYNNEEIIDLIQFLSMNEEFNGYNSVSKSTAKYFLKQFKNKKNGII